MSTTTDNRVVEMRFNNQQFEKNAKESIGTLDKLKEALKFDRSSVKGLEDLQRSTKSFNLDSVTKSVDKVSDHFSAMGVVGMTVMNRITNAAIDFGKKAFAGMTGGLDAGFEKYSSKMEAVQVMMINSGEALEKINTYLDDLQFYTDETSYSFSQMVSTMGKFTSSNVELAVAEETVKGIANWAATAGVNAVNAETAFDVMSKAIAQGYLTRQQADRLNMMNMFTPAARRLLLEISADMGTIRKEGDAFFANVSTGKKIREEEVTVENLVSLLTKSKFATSDVLLEFAHLYNATAEELDDYDRAILEAAGLTEHFGEEAYDAAYVAKTFKDAIGSITDALSSGWSRTFEYIFGNYEEAAETWTLLANAASTVVIEMAEARNEVLSLWKALGGRRDLIYGIIRGVEALAAWLEPIKNAFSDIFGSIDGSKLAVLTYQFRKFMYELYPTNEALEVVYATFFDLFSVIKGFTPLVKGLLKIAGNVLGVCLKLAYGFSQIALYMVSLVQESGFFERAVEAIEIGLKVLGATIVYTVASIATFINTLRQLPAVQTIVHGAFQAIVLVAQTLAQVVGFVIVKVYDFITAMSQIGKSGLPTFFEKLESILERVLSVFNKLKESVTNFFRFISGKSSDLKNSINLGEKLSKTTADVSDKIKGLDATVAKTKLEENFNRITTAAKEFFGELTVGKVAAGASALAIVGLVKKLSSAGNKTGIGGIGAGGSMFDILFNATSMVKRIALIGVLGGTIGLLIKHFKKVKDASDSAKAAAKSLDEISESEDRLLGISKKAQPVLSFFSGLGNSLKTFALNVANSFGIATDGVTNFFKKLTLGRVILGSFAVAVIATVAQIAFSLAGIPLLSLSLSKALFDVGNAIRNWSIWGVDTFGDTCIKLAKSLIYFAGAIWVVAQVPTEKFKEVTGAVAGFMKALLAIAGISAFISILGKSEDISSFGSTMLSLAASVLLLAGAMKILESADPTIKATIEELIVVLGLVSVLGSAFSKSKSLTISFENAKISFFELTLAITSLAYALYKLSEVDTDKLKASSNAMLKALGGFAAVLFAAAKLTFTGKGALFGALAVLSLAVTFKIIVDTLASIKDIDFVGDDILKTIGKIALVLGTMATLYLAIHLVAHYADDIAKDAAFIGLALLTVSASMGILSGVVVFLSKMGEYMSPDGIGYMFTSLIAMGAALGLAMKGFAGVTKDAAKASLALIGVGVVLAELAALGIILALIPDPEMFWKAAGSIVGLGLLVSLINKTVSMIKPGSWKPLVAVIGIVAVIAGSLYGLSKYGDIEKIGSIAKDMAMVIGVLGVVLFSVQKFARSNNSIWKTIAAFSAAIAMIGVAIAAIGTVEVGQALAGAAGISIVLLAIAGAVKLLSSFRVKQVNMQPVAAMIIALIPICVGLEMIARHNFLQILAAAGGVSLVLMALAESVKILSSFRAKKIDPWPILTLSAAIVAIGYSLSLIAKFNWLQIGVAAVAVAGTLLALGPAMNLISSASTKPINPGPLIAVCAALGVIAYSLYEVASKPWEAIRESMVGINATLVVLTAVMYALSTLSQVNVDGMLGGAVAFDILAASTIVLANAFKVLAEVPFESLIPNLLALGGALVVLLVGGAILGKFPMLIAGVLGLAAALLVISGAAIGFATSASIIVDAIIRLTTALTNLGYSAPVIGENIRQMFITIGDGIGTGLATIVTSFTEKIFAAIDFLFNGIIMKGINFIGEFTAFMQLGFQTLISTANSYLPSLGEIGVGIAKAIWFAFRAAWMPWSGDLAKGLEEGTEKAKPVAEKSGKNIAQAFVDNFRDVLGWHSPPELSENFFDDLVSSILSNTPSVAGIAGDSGGSISGAFGSSFLDNLSSYIGDADGVLAGFFNKWGSLLNNPILAKLFGGGLSALTEGLGGSFGGKSRKFEKNKSLVSGYHNFKDSDSYKRQQELAAEEEIARNYKIRQDLEKAGYKSESERAMSGGSGGGGGGGGSAKKAAEEAKELFDVWKDGGKVIQKVAENFGSAYEKLGYTHPLELGADAVSNLATKMWELAHTGEDAATLASYTTEEKLAEMKELFDNFYNDVRETIQGAGDIFGGFAENSSESMNDWVRNLDKQEAAIDNWVRHIEQLSARGARYDVVQQFISWGPQEDARLRKMLAAPEATFNALSDRIVAYNDYNFETANARTERVYAALAATLIDKTEETAEEASEVVEQAATETETALEDATNKYVVVNRQGAVSVINTVGQVIQANSQLAQSAFDVAKVTQQALSEVEDAYISTKQAVLDAVNVDIFSKFDTETSVDKEEIIDTAHDTLNAWTEMYDGMGKLAERGLSKDFILNKLVPMGESAYAYVQAMLEMTQDELAGFNSMFEQAMSLPATLAEQLGASVANAALLATQGIVSGLGNEATYNAAKEAATGIVNTMINEINNPGSGAATVGTATAEGTAEGITSGQALVDKAGLDMVNNACVVCAAGAETASAKVGEGLISGLVDYLESPENQARVAQAYASLGEVGNEAYEDEEEINSPSKVFARYGKYLVLGLTNGIYNNANLISEASTFMADSATESMKAVVGHIADIINGDVQVDPTIRPVLDLSNVEAGAAAVNSMFGGTSYNLTRGVDAQTTSSSINDLLNQMALSQATPVTAGAPINMYVYAAPGQSEEEIANIVEQKLMFRINRQGGVWK